MYFYNINILYRIKKRGCLGKSLVITRPHQKCDWKCFNLLNLTRNVKDYSVALSPDSNPFSSITRKGERSHLIRFRKSVDWSIKGDRKTFSNANFMIPLFNHIIKAKNNLQQNIMCVDYQARKVIICK